MFIWPTDLPAGRQGTTEKLRATEWTGLFSVVLFFDSVANFADGGATHFFTILLHEYLTPCNRVFL
jgi:hypothetical protein